MNKCSGLSGKLFGHKFKEFILTETCTNKKHTEFEYTGRSVKDMTEILVPKNRTYCVKCARCGEKL